MQEKKFKKIVVGATVAAVILFVLLIVFLVGQLISISSQKKREQELLAQIEEYKQIIATAKNDIDMHNGRMWLEIAARELGMKSPGDLNWDELELALQSQALAYVIQPSCVGENE